MKEIKWRAILNPCAGEKRLKKDLKKIFACAERLDLDVDWVWTQYKGHASKIAQESVDNGCLNLLVFGGDGTLNEVVNGVFCSSIENKSDVCVALVPYGTGNDWGRFWGIGRNIEQSLGILKKGKEQLVDVGKTTLSGKTSYFLNAIGMGFDAQVLKLASTIKNHFLKGGWIYSLSVFITVFIHKSVNMSIFCDGKNVLNERVYTISVGNGCYTGGGLKQTPDALPNDGFFHATVVKKLSFKAIVLAVKHLFFGNLLDHPCVESYKTKRIVFKSDKPVEIEADGVQLNAHSDVEVEVIPNAIKFLVSQK